MPIVPSYDKPTVAPAGLPGVMQQAPSRLFERASVGPAEDIKAGQKLVEAGGEIAREAIDAQILINESAVKEKAALAMDGISKILRDPQSGYLYTPGKAAIDGQGAAAQAIQDLNKNIADGITNDAQRRMWNDASMRLTGQAMNEIRTHAGMQTKEYAYQSTVEMAKAAGQTALSDSPNWNVEGSAFKSGMATLKGQAEEAARLKFGATADPKMIEGFVQQALSANHVKVIDDLISRNKPADAAAYLAAYGTAKMRGGTFEIDPSVMDSLRKKVAEAGDIATAEAVVGKAWTEIGPKQPNDPVKLFDLEERVRNDPALKDNPKAVKEAIAGLRERSAAFNAQQAEVNAAGVNAVYAQLDAGASMAAVRRSTAWLELPALERDKISAQQESRAATRASRAASEASRELTAMQRNERLAFMQNGDKYLTITDPDVLSRMSRAQVEAKRSEFGMEATQQLLQKWDHMKANPQKVIEARMDTDDFNIAADSLGLKPFARDNSEDHKRMLGTLKYRVENLINLEQVQQKRMLTREEKMRIVQREMATQVALPGWLYGENNVPVIQMTPEQMSKVVVPKEEREQVIKGLQTMYRKYPTNPAFAPTEDNIRRTYLMRISPAAGFIQNAK